MGVVTLHGVEARVAVSSTNHIEFIVKDGNTSCTAWGRHPGDVGPLLGTGVISMCREGEGRKRRGKEWEREGEGGEGS